MGACQKCDGLGVIQFFDPKRIVVHPELSLAAGAIRGWDRRNPFYFQMLCSLAAHYGFAVEAPFSELARERPAGRPLRFRARASAVHYVNERGRLSVRQHAFEGIVVNLERRYKETDSQAVREELARLISNQTCPPATAAACAKKHATCASAPAPAHAPCTSSAACHLPKRATIFSLQLPGNKAQIAEKVLKEIVSRLQFLINVGLDYLSLDRSAETLSGGEAQRIRLASQIGSGLTGVMYVLDEPSIGLHQRDNERLLKTLQQLRDIGNTVIVVEHDEEAIRSADYVVDIGPGAGVHGGFIVAEGPPAGDHRQPGLTDRRLPGRPPAHRHARASAPAGCAAAAADRRRARQQPANVSVDLPVGLLTCITGVSGSGKSTLINDTLYAAAARHLYGSSAEAAEHDRIVGLDHFDKVINVDQSPIGRTPRSNPATYTGLLTPIRELFAGSPKPARAATGRAASRSTSRAGAARPARATA
jgi:excinuclease ABC subunit A